MISGPDIVIACPSCKKFLRVASLMSGNTTGMVRWSDGYVKMPMLPPAIDASCCVHCRQFFWVDTAEEVGMIDDDDEDDHPVPDVPFAVPLTYEQLGAVVDRRLWRDEDEELRTRYQWRWRMNQPYRESGKEVPLGPDMEANLSQIAEIYARRKARTDLALAEVVWHLGEFDRALELLDGVNTPELQTDVSSLRKAIETGKRRIFKL